MTRQRPPAERKLDAYRAAAIQEGDGLALDQRTEANPRREGKSPEVRSCYEERVILILDWSCLSWSQSSMNSALSPCFSARATSVAVR